MPQYHIVAVRSIRRPFPPALARWEALSFYWQGGVAVSRSPVIRSSRAVGAGSILYMAIDFFLSIY